MEDSLNRIMSLMQEGTVSKYCDEFQLLFDQVKNYEEISEYYAIYLFMDGLEPEIRDVFIQWHQYSFHTVKDAISLALKLDANELKDSFSPFDPNSSFYNKDLVFDINISLKELMKDNEWFRNGKIQETCDNIVQEIIVEEVIDAAVLEENGYNNKVAFKVFVEMPQGFNNEIDYFFQDCSVQDPCDDESKKSEMDDSMENKRNVETNKELKLKCSDVSQEDVPVVMGSYTLYQVMAKYNFKKCGLSSFATVYEYAKKVSCVKDFEVKARNLCGSGEIVENEIDIPNKFMPYIQQVALGRSTLLVVNKVVIGVDYTVANSEDGEFYGSGWGRYGNMIVLIWTHLSLNLQSDGYDIWMVPWLDVTTDEYYDANIFNEFEQLSWTDLRKSMLLIMNDQQTCTSVYSGKYEQHVMADQAVKMFHEMELCAEKGQNLAHNTMFLANIVCDIVPIETNLATVKDIGSIKGVTPTSTRRKVHGADTVVVRSLQWLELLIQCCAKITMIVNGVATLHLFADIGIPKLTACLLKAGGVSNMTNKDILKPTQATNPRVLESMFKKPMFGVQFEVEESLDPTSYLLDNSLKISDEVMKGLDKEEIEDYKKGNKGAIVAAFSATRYIFCFELTHAANERLDEVLDDVIINVGTFIDSGQVPCFEEGSHHEPINLVEILSYHIGENTEFLWLGWGKKHEAYNLLAIIMEQMAGFIYSEGIIQRVIGFWIRNRNAKSIGVQAQVHIAGLYLYHKWKSKPMWPKTSSTDKDIVPVNFESVLPYVGVAILGDNISKVFKGDKWCT